MRDDPLLSALMLGLDLVQRSEIQAKINPKSISFVLIKLDIGIDSWLELPPIIHDYRQALKALIVPTLDFDTFDVLDYLDSLYASLEQAFDYQGEQMTISFCLSNQPKDLVKFADEMAGYRKQLTSLIRMFN